MQLFLRAGFAFQLLCRVVQRFLVCGEDLDFEILVHERETFGFALVVAHAEGDPESPGNWKVNDVVDKAVNIIYRYFHG